MSSLLRSTKFVRYFTGAARTLINNAAKTTETTTLINPNSLCGTNHALVRDYATSKKSEQLEPLLQKLDTEVKRFGRISKKDIDEVFEEIKSKNDITSSQSLLVIRCCGELVPEELPEQRTLLVQKIWNVLTERGIPMDISHYNALLRVYIENEHPFSPAKILEELETKGLQPNRVTYQRLMWRYCQDGDVKGATNVLEKMRELNFPVSEPVLNALVMGYAYRGDAAGANTVIKTMAGAGLQPTNRTFTFLACGYARQGDMDGVTNVFKTATESDAPLTDKDVLDVIEQLAISGHNDKVEQLFGYIQKSPGYNQDVCNLIFRLLNKGEIETAKAVMKTMPKSPNVDNTIFKGAFFVKQLVKISKDPETVIRICNELKDEDLVPNAIYIATETALQQGRSDIAEKLFKEIEKEGIEIRQHYYWPLLVKKGKEGDEEGLLQILRSMSTNGQVPSGETLRDYVIPYLLKKDTPNNVVLKLQIANVPSILSARNLMIELLDAGKIVEAANIALQYRLRGQFNLVSRSLLNALNKTRDIDSFVKILHVMTSKVQTYKAEDETTSEDNQTDDRNDSNETGRLIKTAVKILSKPELVETLLSQLHLKGIKIDVQSAKLIEEYLDRNMTTKISEVLTKLTSVDLELAELESSPRHKATGVRTTAQLEKLLEQLQSKEGNNVTRLQKQLLTAYLKENDVEKLEAYLVKLKSTTFELHASTLAQLYEFYLNNNLIEKAKECQAEISEKHPEFILNRYKLVLMVEALVKANKFDEALQFLKDNANAVSLDDGSFLVNSKCWQVLNDLAEQKETEKVNALVTTLIDNKYIEPSNIIFGPSIKVQLLNEDLDGALKQFEYFCKQYRCTPWKGELMKALIVKEDANRLQWLADVSTQIHGEVNILHDLVLAFVECGRLRQARRILETPGMHPRQRRLHDACQRYLEEGKSEYLENLLEATKELSHIDRSNIIYHLLKTYCKADETDKALGLWTILQEDGDVPSDQFLSVLGNHLKEKNRTVPFVMPEDNSKPITKKVTQPKQKPAVTNDPNAIKPIRNDLSREVEAMINESRLDDACKLVASSLKSNVNLKESVLKYLLKSLAEKGLIEKIEEVGNFMSETLKRNVAFEDKVTLATFVKGDGVEHVNKLYKTVQETSDPEQLEVALRKFPRSGALVTAITNEEIMSKCQKIAEVAAQAGITIPANLLWLEFLLIGKNEEAQAIWDKFLINSSSILFRRLLQESHIRNTPEVVENLISYLKTNKLITKGSLGNAYSRLLNHHIGQNKLDEAERVLQDAIDNGVQHENINKNCIAKLKEAMAAAGKEFKFFN